MVDGVYMVISLNRVILLGLGTVGAEVEFKDPIKAMRLKVIVFYFMFYVCLMLNVCSTSLFMFAKKSFRCLYELY